MSNQQNQLELDKKRGITERRDNDMWKYHLENLKEGCKHGESVQRCMEKFYIGTKHSVYRILTEQRKQHKQKIDLLKQNGGL